jgi:adenylate cyclase
MSRKENAAPVETPRDRRIRVLPDDMETLAMEGTSILAASLRAGIPHCHECGGNARCSTCRVVVVDGLETCAPRNEREQAISDRLHFPPEVRLACQTRATGELVVRRLVLDDVDVELTSLDRGGLPNWPVGKEQRLAILFLDIRGFTSFSESLLPYDVIHLLRRFFLRMGRIVERYGGVVDNYMGDGMLALFGRDEAGDAALRAVRAGLAMLAEAEHMKPYERSIGGKSFEIGVGVHYGEVVVGAVAATSEPKATVIGDAVNMASRVESANKVTGTRLLVSEAAFRELRGEMGVRRSFQLSLPGKTGMHTLYEIERPDTPTTV